MFFLPPPQINTLKTSLLTLDKSENRAAPITLAVKSVSVVAPSSKERPLANETSKSFVSKDKLFWLGLLENNSCACSKIISFLFPLYAIFAYQIVSFVGIFDMKNP